MTDPKLREARIAEAKRRASAEGSWKTPRDERVAHHLIDLIESDWRPEPEVDAVKLAAEEWAWSVRNRHVLSYGAWSLGANVDAFRAGHAHALANHPDAKRMDWLEQQGVLKVFRLGTLRLECVAGVEPLRDTIDRALEQRS